MGRIVVGVDESQPSRAALAWAMDEAKLRQCRLDIVLTWNQPVMATAEPIIVPLPEAGELIATAKATAAALVHDAGLDTSGIEYRIITPQGRAGEELVHEAETADLLVVGSHGSGPLKELILGSVSSYCCHHSKCPVVLVRSP